MTLKLTILLGLGALACDDSGGAEPMDPDGTVADMRIQTDAAADVGRVDFGLEADMTADMRLPDAAMDGPPAAYTALCSGCHGPDGEGSASGVELLHPIADFATWVIRTGRPAGDADFQTVMGSYDAETLTDADLEGILAWLNGAPRPETGEALYVDLCANCHGADGEGGIVREGARHSAASIQRHVRNGEGGAAYASRQRYMPAFGPDVLTARELQLIIDHLTE